MIFLAVSWLLVPQQPLTTGADCCTLNVDGIVWSGTDSRLDTSGNLHGKDVLSW